MFGPGLISLHRHRPTPSAPPPTDTNHIPTRIASLRLDFGQSRRTFRSHCLGPPELRPGWTPSKRKTNSFGANVMYHFAQSRIRKCFHTQQNFRDDEVRTTKQLLTIGKHARYGRCLIVAMLKRMSCFSTESIRTLYTLSGRGKPIRILLAHFL